MNTFTNSLKIPLPSPLPPREGKELDWDED